ncbi:hypothetical protein ACVIRM_005682 [Rhizobium laguerreae]
MLKRFLGATLMVASLGTASIAADAKSTDPRSPTSPIRRDRSMSPRQSRR